MKAFRTIRDLVHKKHEDETSQQVGRAEFGNQRVNYCIGVIDGNFQLQNPGNVPNYWLYTTLVTAIKFTSRQGIYISGARTTLSAHLLLTSRWRNFSIAAFMPFRSSPYSTALISEEKLEGMGFKICNRLPAAHIHLAWRQSMSISKRSVSRDSRDDDFKMHIAAYSRLTEGLRSSHSLWWCA